MDALSRILNGSIDLHVHPAPSLYPRLFDEVEGTRLADEVGMRAIVVKSHHHSTASDAQMLSKYALQGVKTQLFGSIVLNSYVGGVNPYAVNAAIRYGARIVWFPTISNATHIEHANKNFPTQRKGGLAEVPMCLIDAQGELIPQAREVLGLVAEADIAVSPGHASPAEVLALLNGARESGVKRMIVNHPEFIIEASEAQIKEFVRLGAYIEHSIGMFMVAYPPEKLVEAIDLVGPEKTLLGSDLGQTNFPWPLEAYRTIIPQLLDRGVRESDIELMTKQNPAWLLKLD